MLMVLGLANLTGCLVDDALPDDRSAEQPDTATVEQAASNCSDWMCGSNSAELGRRPFHELSSLGYENLEGFRIRYVLLNGASGRVRVDGGELVFERQDGSEIRGTSVAGLRIFIRHDVTATTYEVRVATVTRVSYSARRPDMIIVPRTYAYGFKWVSGTGTLQNLCPPTAEPSQQLGDFDAVVFEGDRVDRASLAVTGFDSNWFNIGCAGHALAKMHLTGHSYAARADGYDTTRDERTTMLKMITGDYCGTGRPFTVAGMPLTWSDDRDWMNYSSSSASLEARWTPHGAACINVPRFDANPELRPDEYGASVRDEINAECGHTMPACGLTWTTYHLLSAHP